MALRSPSAADPGHFAEPDRRPRRARHDERSQRLDRPGLGRHLHRPFHAGLQGPAAGHVDALRPQHGDHVRGREAVALQRPGVHHHGDLALAPSGQFDGADAGDLLQGGLHHVLGHLGELLDGK
jgi:hypothetical protein